MLNWEKTLIDRYGLLQQAIAQGLSSLDAEVLLAHVLGLERIALHTWPHQAVEQKDSEQFFYLVNRRLNGEPVAYLVGKKEFWSLSLEVTPEVLIPRPETELIVELTLKLLANANNVNPDQSYRILELGTGSGAISLALAKERPYWSFVATDISSQALAVASKNAKRLSISNVEFYKGDWFAALSALEPSQQRFHAIISNPPYIPDHDPHLQHPDLRFEPQLALKAGPLGLRDLKKIIKTAPQYLLSKGWLMVEHGFDQAVAVLALFEQYEYQNSRHYQDLAGINRVTVGQQK